MNTLFFNNKYLIIYSIIVLVKTDAVGQGLNDLSFGTDSTFDVITWNVEWFPKNGLNTVDSVNKIIRALDADIIGLQEIDDTSLCRQMINDIPGYELFMDDDWFGGLAYVYNSNTVTVHSIYKIYDTAPYWNTFPRSPLVIELTHNGEHYIVINNHYKCCGDGILDMGNTSDEEYRRYQANTLLKQYITSNFDTNNVLVIGDLNDLINEPSANNVFDMFINDSSAYYFADSDIASGPSSSWSFPNWPSHLDHILITNELFQAFAHPHSQIQTIKVDDYFSAGFPDYDYYVSDHRPVGIKIKHTSKDIGIIAANKSHLKISPNPSSEWIQIDLTAFSGVTTITISDINGKIIHLAKYQGGQLLDYHFKGLPGLYFLSAESGKLKSRVKWLKRY
ncbi:MAG: endonuclease/exonuclease/phosphatase family protein [Bacteroidota bacterium]|nr:endonuclease/exonuclease/phosphatase family protein [Bacteroidota bacterium]